MKLTIKIILAWAALLLLISAIIIPALPVGAVDPPDSVAINNAKVYRNLAEDGDMLVVFQYAIIDNSDNYSATPASASIIFRMYDTDGETLLTATNPYVFPFWETNGYGTGVAAFYIETGADQPAWEAEAIINIFGVPAYFSPAISVDYTIESDDYTDSELQDDNREELYDYVLLLCDELGALYEDTGVVLKTSADSGIVLSTYGELYFRGAIEGLQALCPDLFFIQVYVPEKMLVDYDTSLLDDYTDRTKDTEIEESMELMGGAIGVGGAAFSAILSTLAMMALCIWTAKKGWGIEIGMMGSIILAVLAAVVMGDFLFTMVMIGSLVAAMGLSYLVLLKRS